MKKSELKNLITKIILESYRHKDMLGYKLQEAEENNDDLQVKVGKYMTNYFHVCPGARALYDDIESKVDDMGLAERAAKLQDALFFIEQHVLEDYNEDVPEGYVLVAENLAEQIMAMASMMGLADEHDYLQSHVDKIKAAI